ncbi:hypothetical protein [Afifella pfennigii]|uniref:hypothetical protein n=1 Tax=Afifella pfennigii TaxID=209897 RepID=UPI00047B3103|nr:hypothetical protein [Afifella pfennigii]
MADLQTALDTTVNCCNGRVGRRIMELAAQDERFARLAQPTGIELVQAAAKAGLAASDTVNCCNGRVGRQMNLKDIVAELSATAE